MNWYLAALFSIIAAVRAAMFLIMNLLDGSYYRFVG